MSINHIYSMVIKVDIIPLRSNNGPGKFWDNTVTNISLQSRSINTSSPDNNNNDNNNNESDDGDIVISNAVVLGRNPRCGIQDVRIHPNALKVYIDSNDNVIAQTLEFLSVTHEGHGIISKASLVHVNRTRLPVQSTTLLKDDDIISISNENDPNIKYEYRIEVTNIQNERSSSTNDGNNHTGQQQQQQPQQQRVISNYFDNIDDDSPISIRGSDSVNPPLSPPDDHWERDSRFERALAMVNTERRRTSPPPPATAATNKDDDDDDSVRAVMRKTPPPTAVAAATVATNDDDHDDNDIRAERRNYAAAVPLAAAAKKSDDDNDDDENALSIFSENISEEISCSVCLDIMVYPQTVVPCGHSFCGHCMKPSIRDCPHCRAKIESKVQSRQLQSLISILTSIPTLFKNDDIEHYQDRMKKETPGGFVVSSFWRAELLSFVGSFGFVYRS
jgi:hypothetical protein